MSVSFLLHDHHYAESCVPKVYCRVSNYTKFWALLVYVMFFCFFVVVLVVVVFFHSLLKIELSTIAFSPRTHWIKSLWNYSFFDVFTLLPLRCLCLLHENKTSLSLLFALALLWEYCGSTSTALSLFLWLLFILFLLLL